jgi:exopolysaccharide production protein ExoQ
MKRFVLGGALLLALAILGALGASDANILLVVPAVAAFVGLLVFTYRSPARAMTLAFLLIPIAGTKFRNRNAMDAVNSVVDGQVILELAIYALIGIMTLIIMYATRFRWPRLTLTARVVLAFTGLTAISAFWSYAPMLTLVRSIQLATLVLLTIVAVTAFGASRVTRALTSAVIIYVLVCAALAAAFPAFQGTTTDHQGIRRFSWFSLHPITVAVYVGIALVLLAAGLMYGREGLRRRLLGIPEVLYLIPLGVILMATNSRGPLFAVIATIALLVAVKVLRPVAATAVIAAALLSVLAFNASGMTFDSLIVSLDNGHSPLREVVLRGQTPEEFESLTGRTELWTELVPLYWERPMLGFGYQASRQLVLETRPWAGHAHNGLIETMLDVGIVGTLLLWIPVLSILFLPRGPADDRQREWLRVTFLVAIVFSLLNSATDVGFAGPTGLETEIVLLCVFGAECLKAALPLPVREAQSAAPGRRRPITPGQLESPVTTSYR